MLLLVLPASSRALVVPPTPPSPSPSYDQQLADVATLDAQVLGDFLTNVPAGLYFENGVWHNPAPVDCYTCLDSAATAAAVLFRQGGEVDHSLANVAIQTFDYAIEHDQLADGSFAAEGTANGPIATEFEAVELGTTYLELQDVLAPATKTSWVRAITRAAEFTIDSGQLSWYANGNIQLRNTELMWLAWRVTGAQRFRDAYDAEWSFTVSPPQDRWPGFGLQITRSPTRADGSDGAGYLGEATQPAPPGFDPEYTMSQLDIATGLWVFTREPRYLRLMNLLFNQLRPRIDSQFTFDATGGTRHSDVLPFYSVAPDLLFHSGDRPDLASAEPVQVWRMDLEFTNTDHNTPYYYKGLSAWLSLLLLDAQWPAGLGVALPQAPPQITVTPAALTTQSLVQAGVQVTVSNLQPGSSVGVELRSGADHSQVLARRTARTAGSHRLRVRLVPRRRRGRRAVRGARAIQVRVTIHTPGARTRSVQRALALR